MRGKKKKLKDHQVIRSPTFWLFQAKLRLVKKELSLLQVVDQSGVLTAHNNKKLSVLSQLIDLNEVKLRNQTPAKGEDHINNNQVLKLFHSSL